MFSKNSRTGAKPLKLVYSIKLALLTVALLLLGIFAVPLLYRAYQAANIAFNWQTVRNTTLSILRSEDLAFLVSKKLVSVVVVEKSENNLFLGERYGVLIADVELTYGFNLQKLTEDSISRDGNKIIIKLPEPEKFNCAVNLSSMRYITKASSLNYLLDNLNNADIKRELRADFERSAFEYFKQKKLIPGRAQMISRLNNLATPLFAKSGISVEFR